MKRNFSQAWETYVVGDEIFVRDGRAEPPVTGSKPWFMWRAHNPTGELVEKVDGPPRELVVKFSPSEGVEIRQHIVEGAADYTFQRVTQTLEDAKLAKWAEVKELRDILEQGPAPTPLGNVQTDDASKIKISGLVQMAQIAISALEPFTEHFTMADNTVVEVDALEMISIGVAAGQYVSAVHATARALRVAITACTTIEEVEAVDVEGAGWP